MSRTHLHNFKSLYAIGLSAACLTIVFAPLNAQDSPGKDSLGYPDAKEVLSGETLEAKKRALLKVQLLSNISSFISERGAAAAGLDFQMNNNRHISLYLSREKLREIYPVGPDPLDDEIRQMVADIPPTVSLNSFLGNLVDSLKKPKAQKKGRLTEILIPTDLEIDILKELWADENEALTAGEIYVNLDTTWKMTSEDLNRIMEQMVHRGLVNRKQLSPAHEFGLFGIAKIELSSKNSKNRVYLYWPLIDKESLMTYLDAKRYLATRSQYSKADGAGDRPYAALAQKLIRLSQ